MHVYREIWVRNLLNREARMVDMQIMASLQNGTAFFASTTLLAIGGAGMISVVALLVGDRLKAMADAYAAGEIALAREGRGIDVVLPRKGGFHRRSMPSG